MEEYEEAAQGEGIQSLALAALKNCFLVGGSSVKLDIKTRRMVSKWNFEKKWHDISNSKGSQFDPSASTFLGLDDNRLCRWDSNSKRS
ncbi:hypothetical protein IFM89_020552 [Coptis chinensis]|nr:hypothetical protein IFM89_020552 [Coptis chinensis]